MADPKNYQQMRRIFEYFSPQLPHWQANFINSDGVARKGKAIRLYVPDEHTGMEVHPMTWKVEMLEEKTGVKGFVQLTELVSENELMPLFKDFNKLDCVDSRYVLKFQGAERANAGMVPAVQIREDVEGRVHFYLHFGIAQDEAHAINKISPTAIELWDYEDRFQNLLEILLDLKPIVSLGGPATPTLPYDESLWRKDYDEILLSTRAGYYNRILLGGGGNSTECNKRQYKRGFVYTSRTIMFYWK